MSLQEQVQQMFPAQSDLPPDVRFQGFQEQREYLVGGKMVQWAGSMQEIVSPVCVRTAAGLEPQVIGSTPLLTEREALQALNAAVEAYGQGSGAWPTMTVAERIRHVTAFTERMKTVRTEVVKFLMWEIGKSKADSEKEFDRTIDYIRDTIDALKDLDRKSSRFEIEQGIVAQIRRAPWGVVLCMGPFNYPLNETFTTLLPALIMGNTLVVKPPKLGVLVYRPLLEAFRECFPPGVVNTVYGDGKTVVGPLMTSGKVDALAFIGTSKVANILEKQHPRPNRLRSILGLDAKNPAIILDDANLDLAVKECVLGSLSFNGQRCTALKILFVQRRVAEDFVNRFAAAVNKLKFGMPWQDVALTPLPEPGKPQFLAQMVEDAVQKGATVRNEGGGASEGTFFFPAVLYPVSPNARLYSEEQFGPLIPIVPFDDVAQPIRYIVESDFGQQVSLFGSDPARLASLIDPLVNQVCRVNLNSQCQRGPDQFPFTGRKDSAEATLSISDALRAFSIRTLVAAKETEANKSILTDIVRKRSSKFLTTDFIL